MKKTKLLLALCLAGSLAHAQIIYTVAGNGTAGFTGDGGLAQSAELNFPDKIAFDATGNMYVSDAANNRVRKITPTGLISTYAGNGTGGFSGDAGQASAAELNNPEGLNFDASGNLYIADEGNNRIRKVTPTGIITTIAGNGTAGFSGDAGQATSAELQFPTDIYIDGSGNLYIADDGNGRIRKVNTSGVISTIAGNGTYGFSGDGGPAGSAEFRGPSKVIVDATGNIYIEDVFNFRIRKINTSGIINTIVGNGTSGYTGDGGQATSAEIKGGGGMVLDASGNLYFSDSPNYCVRKVNTSGIISTITGNGTNGFTGDGGLASLAELGETGGLAFNASGNLYIVDIGNNRVRVITSTCPANAGPNKTVTNPGLCCSGSPAVIGTPAVPNMTYSWSPSTLLTPTNTAQPTSTWSNTSTCQVYTVTVSYSLCTTSSSTVQVCAHAYSGSGCCKVTGIETENQSSLAFTIYPNPASGQATIFLYDKATYIQVLDMQGRLVFEAKDIPAGDFKLDISKYNKGVYFISAKLGDAIEKQKLIVE